MSMTVLVVSVLATSGAFLAAMSLAYAKLPGRRRFPQPEAHLGGKKFWNRVALTGVVSTAFIVTITIGFTKYLVTTETQPLWRMVFDTVAILFVYDFFYYLMHRYPFHQWKFLMRVHAVHHQSHRPIPIHAMHLHPIENLAGISLLLFTTWLFGPVNIYVFGICFFVFSWLNIITHAGMDLPIPYLQMLSVKHDAHHKHMRAGNYATLTPLPDMLFRSVE